LPPNGNVFTPDVTFVNNEGDTVTISPTIIVGVAFVNAKAELNIPVAIDIGGIQLNANLNLSTGDVNFGGSYDTTNNTYNPPAGNACECIPPTGVPTDPPTRPPGVPQPPGEEEDPAEGKRRIVGAIGTVTNDAGQDSIDNSSYGCPNVGVPYYGLVFFVHQSDNGVLSWSQDFHLKTRQQYIPCPFPDGAVAVAAAPRYPQQTVVVTPVYRTDEVNKETEPVT
jgi:hypothetical protein